MLAGVSFLLASGSLSVVSSRPKPLLCSGQTADMPRNLHAVRTDARQTLSCHCRYHPDKNPSPEARAKFLQVQKAYERLQAGAAGGQGPQPWRLLLMLRAQCILFRRYAAVLAPFKYAGYPQLLEVLRQQQVAAEAGAPGAGKASTEAAAGAAGQAAAAGQGAGAQQAASVSSSGSSSGHFLSGERISQVLAAIELCWLTCVASRRNAEELLRSGGLPLLAGLLTRWVSLSDGVHVSRFMFLLKGCSAQGCVCSARIRVESECVLACEGVPTRLLCAVAGVWASSPPTLHPLQQRQ